MSRRDIYYWKCDRPSAFHGIQSGVRADPAGSGSILRGLKLELARHFNAGEVVLRPAAVQGNHLAWISVIDGVELFVRVEDGPEQDAHLAVESTVLDRVRAVGVPTPRVLGCEASRNRVPFAWQALELVPHPDLNHWFKQGNLDAGAVAFQTGVAVARWQAVCPEGFGTLDEGLRGHRNSYSDYFFLRLGEHLHFLKSRGFLSNTDEILSEIELHRSLLSVEQGCLVHKDLALWNILGTGERIAAFIDFDDAVSGDPVDDLSLLACFHDAAFLQCALDGYQSLRLLPRDFHRRFWLHLLRNMLVKAVIRVGAGYFARGDGFFLIGAGGSGADLERTTRDRLATALRGLRENSEISIL